MENEDLVENRKLWLDLEILEATDRKGDTYFLGEIIKMQESAQESAKEPITNKHYRLRVRKNYLEILRTIYEGEELLEAMKRVQRERESTEREREREREYREIDR